QTLVFYVLHVFLHLFLISRILRSSPLFPFTTLFRSHLGQVTDFVVVIEHHATVAGDAEVLQQHVAGKYVGSGQLLDRHAVVVERSEETRLNSSHVKISYAVFCLKKKSYTEM